MLIKQELFTKKIHKLSFFVFLLFFIQNCIQGSDNFRNIILFYITIPSVTLMTLNSSEFVCLHKKIVRVKKIWSSTKTTFFNNDNSLLLKIDAVNNFESCLKNNFKKADIHFTENLKHAKDAPDDKQIQQFYNDKYNYLEQKFFSIRDDELQRNDINFFCSSFFSIISLLPFVLK